MWNRNKKFLAQRIVLTVYQLALIGLTTRSVAAIMTLEHYANMSVQYSAIFHGCKNDNFQMKFFDIFLIFAQNIDCGYTLEPRF